MGTVQIPQARVWAIKVNSIIRWVYNATNPTAQFINTLDLCSVYNIQINPLLDVSVTHEKQILMTPS